MTENGTTMDLQLRDKLAIVTGSSKGIGHAIATSLAREGARVVVNGRSEASVTTAIDGIRALVPSAKVHPFAGDLSRADAAEALIRAFPEPDILVNNLGIFEPVPFEQIPDDDWRRFFEVNVLSGVRLSRLVLAGMKARDWGRIVFISSESAVQIPTEMIHYGMTKTAQLAVSRGLAQLCAGTGVTVNSVLPGPTRSAGVEDFVAALSGGRPFEDAEQEFFKTARPTSLLRRFATTEEVANMVTYVCSPLSSATNGAALRVDGGVLLSADMMRVRRIPLDFGTKQLHEVDRARSGACAASGASTTPSIVRQALAFPEGCACSCRMAAAHLRLRGLQPVRRRPWFFPMKDVTADADDDGPRIVHALASCVRRCRRSRRATCRPD